MGPIEDIPISTLAPAMGVPDSVGIPFEGYHLVRKIAVGGMAEVYLGIRHGQFGFRRQEVVKVLLPRLAHNQEFVDMFIREAVLAAEFRHPHLVQIYEVGKTGELYYIAMEFVDGVDLMRLVRRCRQASQPLSLDLVLSVAAHVADALGAVHEAKTADGTPLNIVHRDVTPQNLMVGFDGQVKLVDFGVAQTLLARAHANKALMGKGPYMAPEQWSDGKVDHRADIFALGTVLYELTVGKRLFRRPTPEETREAIVTGQVPRPGRIRAGFPANLEEVILRSLALDPRDRFPTAQSMRRAIEDVQNSLGGAMHRDERAQWLSDLFHGVARDDLWPKLDLTEPGKRTEADEALRRATLNLPAFSDDESSSGLAGAALPTRNQTTNKQPKKTTTASPIEARAVALLAAGAVGGALLAALVAHFL
ncbi:MAG: serine/threonine protein kinase [Deltaproteobacteria bacterium]|nr:serine/threonine protein kinase [Deltaproteobacteria bacterium]